jgi:hypothetical protein
MEVLLIALGIPVAIAILASGFLVSHHRQTRRPSSPDTSTPRPRTGERSLPVLGMADGRGATLEGGAVVAGRGAVVEGTEEALVAGGKPVAGGSVGAAAAGAPVVLTAGTVVPVVVVGSVEVVTGLGAGVVVAGCREATCSSSRVSLTTTVVTPTARRTIIATSNSVCVVRRTTSSVLRNGDKRRGLDRQSHVFRGAQRRP